MGKTEEKIHYFQGRHGLEWLYKRAYIIIPLTSIRCSPESLKGKYLIYLTHMQLNTSASGETLSTIITFPVLIMTVIAPFFLHYLVHKNRMVVGNKKWMKKFGTLTDGLNVTNERAIYWNVI